MRGEPVEKRHDYGAEGALREALRRDPTSTAAYVRLARHLGRSGRHADARTVLQEGLARATDTVPVERDMGLLLAGAGDLGQATRHLKRAVELAPADARCLRDLALVLGADGRTDESVAALRQASELAGESGATWDGLLRVGERALREQGRPPERRPPKPARREAYVEATVTRHPELAEALLPLKGREPTAPVSTLRAVRRALAKLLRDHPSYADLHYRFSLVSGQLGEVDRAIEAAEKALEINPRYAEAALLAVRLYERRGRADRAADHCRRVTELRPRWIDAHVRLGDLLRVQGQSDEAAEAYRRALALDGSCDGAKQGLAAAVAAAARPDRGADPAGGGP